MVKLLAAGSLMVALGEVADIFEEETGVTVERAFAPSGLLRHRIEDGEAVDVFAAANMAHPRALWAAGRAGPTVLFARNGLCALAAPGLAVDTDTLLDVLLDPGVRLGTSTPVTDPSGDYTWAMFHKAGELRPGAAAQLGEKALPLTGGPDGLVPPDGRDPYGFMIESGQADIVITYRTNALIAREETPELAIVDLPDALFVHADDGLTVMDGAPVEAWRFAFFILSPEGQAVLARYGFDAPCRQKGDDA